MKLDGRRESTNVDDRRGRGSMARVGGIGLAVASKIGDDYLQKQAYGYGDTFSLNYAVL